MQHLLPLLLLAAPAFAQLPDAQKASIDDIARKVLADTGVPAASIAIVKDGRIRMAQSYGDARLSPKTPATPSMRFKIGSISKQFTASALLLLAEQRKVSLDDPVSRYLPELTRSKEIALRQLLSHTSGYQDYYPLDYVTPQMARDTTPAQILDIWAKKPLDFDPGTRWQYSNTNYVIAGQVIERLTHRPMFEFVKAHILDPLGMHSAADNSDGVWSDADPTGYASFAGGPARPAVLEGRGWIYAAGELAMTASDLALWDIALMEGKVLQPSSLQELTTEARLKTGTGTAYGLGLGLSTDSNGHRRWSHGGGTAGFTSSNVTLPDDHIAITVLTNGEGPAASGIERQIEDLLLEPTGDPGAPVALERARRLFSGLQKGELDRALVTDDALFFFTPQAIADYAASLGPLAEPSSFTEIRHSRRGGMTVRTFMIQAGGKRMSLQTYILPDGKFAQYKISPAPAAQ
jgi:CubicO group peptidase (beta-lactamase class C family)